MASKRILKKEINAITANLVDEYFLTSEFVPGVDVEKAEVILGKILSLREEFIRRVGANGGKDPKLVQTYYRQLKSDFDVKVDEIISDFEALTKGE